MGTSLWIGRRESRSPGRGVIHAPWTRCGRGWTNPVSLWSQRPERCTQCTPLVEDRIWIHRPSRGTGLFIHHASTGQTPLDLRLRQKSTVFTGVKTTNLERDEDGPSTHTYPIDPRSDRACLKQRQEGARRNARIRRPGSPHQQDSRTVVRAADAPGPSTALPRGTSSECG